MGASALVACADVGRSTEAQMTQQQMRMPVVYLPHGGGPWPFVDLGLDPGELTPLADYLRGLAALPPVRPTALLVVSAHWEEKVPTVMTAERPPMLYDYYGFPRAAYDLKWPAAGSPALAARTGALLDAAGIAWARDGERGFDHGTFVPMMLTYPDADVPCVQLSLVAGLDPATHLALGRALAPLRDEGVLIVGSGMSYHNMRSFRDPRARIDAETFDAWLQRVMTSTAAERDAALARWASAPAARAAHPREEHLLPLMVAAGAATGDASKLAFGGRVFGMPVSAFHFG